jgi:hypothetical protein
MNLPENSNGLMIDLKDYDGGKYEKIAFTREEANRLVALFAEAGCKAVAEMIGGNCYGPRGWGVSIRSVNAKAGNFHRKNVAPVAGIDLKAAKKIAKEAKAEFKARDNGSFRRMAAERSVNAE